MSVCHIPYVGRFAVAAFIFSVGLFQIQAVAQERPDQPNLIILLADDLGWQALKCYDIDTPSVLETPYIDALASEEVMFWQGYSPAPTCAPSRGAIMAPYYTGRLEVDEPAIHV